MSDQRDEKRDLSVAEARTQFADVINAAVRGEVTFITNRGRRVAAVVSVRDGEEIERQQQR